MALPEGCEMETAAAAAAAWNDCQLIRTLLSGLLIKLITRRAALH